MKKKLEESLLLGNFCLLRLCGASEIIKYAVENNLPENLSSQQENCRNHCTAYKYKQYLDNIR
jgi:hypothetical protein